VARLLREVHGSQNFVVIMFTLFVQFYLTILGILKVAEDENTTRKEIKMK
jgi:hypothetical protein